MLLLHKLLGWLRGFVYQYAHAGAQDAVHAESGK